MENETQVIEKSESAAVRYQYQESQGFFGWWFNPRNSYSVIRILLGLVFGILTILSVISDFASMIESFKENPLFTGIMFWIFFPLMIGMFFVGTLLWAGCMYLPYYVFEEEKKGWGTLLKYFGWLILGVALLLGIYYLVL